MEWCESRRAQQPALHAKCGRHGNRTYYRPSMDGRRHRDICVLPEDGPTVAKPAEVAHILGVAHALPYMGFLVSGEPHPVRMEQLPRSFDFQREERDEGLEAFVCCGLGRCVAADWYAAI